MMCARSSFAILIVAGSLAADVGAQGWTMTPIYGGGSVQNVFICPSNPNVWYSFVDMCGPFRSDDRGASWTGLHVNMTSDMCMRLMHRPRGFSVDPRDENSFVLAGGDSESRHMESVYGGILVSRDGGRTYRQTLLKRYVSNGLRRRLGIVLDRDPFDPDRLVTGDDWDGVFVSADNGEDWRTAGLDRTNISDVRFDRFVRNRIYVCAPKRVVNENILLKPGQMPYRTPVPERIAGFFRSDDGGRSWTRLDDDGPVEIVQIPGERTILGNFSEQFVRRSEDGGETWTDYSEGLPVLAERPNKPLQRGRFNAFACGKKGRFWVVADTDGNFYRRGADEPRWTEVPHGPYVFSYPEQEPHLVAWNRTHSCMPGSVVVDERDESHWLLTDWYNIMESFDGGTSWRSRNAGMQQLVPFTLSCDPNSKDNMIYGLADMRFLCSTNGGKAFFLPKADANLPLGVNHAVWPRREKGTVLVIGGKKDVSLCRSRDAGVTWTRLKAKGLPKLKAFVHGAFTLEEDPTTGCIYTAVSGTKCEPGDAGVYRSADLGETWEWFGKGLPKDAKGLFRDWEHGWNINQITFSPDGSALLQLQNWEVYHLEGDTWVKNDFKVNLRDDSVRVLPERQLIADPFRPGRFLAGATSRGFCIQESLDGGRTFHEMPPFKGKVLSLAFDPHQKDVLYLGAPDALFVSRDGGRHYGVVRDGLALPCGCYRTVVADRNRLFFITDGTGLWMREDVLEQCEPGQGN